MGSAGLGTSMCFGGDGFPLQPAHKHAHICAYTQEGTLNTGLLVQDQKQGIPTGRGGGA